MAFADAVHRVRGARFRCFAHTAFRASRATRAFLIARSRTAFASHVTLAMPDRPAHGSTGAAATAAGGAGAGAAAGGGATGVTGVLAAETEDVPTELVALTANV